MPTSKEVADALGVAAQAANATSAVPGIEGGIAEISAAGVGGASKIAGAGGDPVSEIQRMLSSTPGKDAVEKDWNAALAAKFGHADDPPPAPSADPRSPEDIYEDL